MSKKYYIDGGVVVDSPYFKQENVVCGLERAAIPEGVEILKTNRISENGEKYLLVDDNNPQSIFATYYARTFFCTGYCWAPMFHKTFKDDYEEFQQRLSDAIYLISSAIKPNEIMGADLLSRYSFMTVLSALDTFIADIVLTKITNDEDAFYNIEWTDLFGKSQLLESKELNRGTFEQSVIEKVLRHAYLNKNTIKKTISLVFNKPIEVDDRLNDIFVKRHLIAHRGGRRKDGAFISFSQSEISEVISIVDSYVVRILSLVVN